MYEAVANAAEVVAAVLGIAVTVVAIIVELAATRFNHRISTMFVREPINIAVLSFFVLTTLLCVWVAATTAGQTASLLQQLTMVAVTLALLALLPYFAYVFTFISPINVIRRIKRQAAREIAACTQGSHNGRQLSVARAVDEIQDVLRSAIDSADRDIAMACVDALSELVSEYESTRSSLPEDWFSVSPELAQDADFVSLETSALRRIDQQKIWFEFKVFSHLHNATEHVIPKLRDVANLISIRTRELALESGPINPALLGICLTSFNSYLRTTIRAQDQRTAYYVLSQYRQVAEALTRIDQTERVLEIIRRFEYYARLSFQLDQPFVLETCAYDLVILLEQTPPEQSRQIDAVLDALLALDRPFRSEQQAATIAGVRKAQIRAAATLLERADEQRASRVLQDLASESQISIVDLVRELSAEQESEFWELTPRGVNFNYLQSHLRAQLDTILRALKSPSAPS